MSDVIKKTNTFISTALILDDVNNDDTSVAVADWLDDDTGFQYDEVVDTNNDGVDEKTDDTYHGR